MNRKIAINSVCSTEGILFGAFFVKIYNLGFSFDLDIFDV